MSEDQVEEVSVEKNGWPEHKVSPWPDYVKELMRSMWMNNLPPSRIAVLINEMNVLGKPVHANTISQYFSQLKRKEPDILEERMKVKEELMTAAKESASEMKNNILGKIKQTSLKIVDEVTDVLPTTIRNIIAQLDDPDLKPSTIRELSVSLKIQMDVLEKNSGMDIARRLYEYESRKIIDQKYLPSDPSESRNVTPACVEVSGWDGPEG